MPYSQPMPIAPTPATAKPANKKRWLLPLSEKDIRYIDELLTERDRATRQAVCDGFAKAPAVHYRHISFAVIEGRVMKIQIATAAHLFIARNSVAIERANESELEECYQS